MPVPPHRTLHTARAALHLLPTPAPVGQRREKEPRHLALAASAVGMPCRLCRCDAALLGRWPRGADGACVLWMLAATAVTSPPSLRVVRKSRAGIDGSLLPLGR